MSKIKHFYPLFSDSVSELINSDDYYFPHLLHFESTRARRMFDYLRVRGVFKTNDLKDLTEDKLVELWNNYKKKISKKNNQ